jgi:Family of unknown function (DUF6312)
MSDLRFSSAVQRVVQLRPDGATGYVPVELYRKASTRGKKSSPLVRPIDRALRRMAKAQEIAATTYLERHDRSNEKRRDGWLTDLNDNVWRATRKGGKALKLQRIILPR